MSETQNVLRIGTDCSGIEAPIQALLQLNIPFRHMFSSDIDKYVIQSIKANYHPEIIFGDKDGPFPEGDITKRNIEDIPDIDLYVAGFPCQPFSMAGKREGFEDERGNVFWSCLEVIERKRPRYFILENVRGLLNHDKRNTWAVIWEALSGLEGYNVKWKILNTRHYGIPQNRERVYIVGTQGEFEWPEEKEMQNLKNFVDWKDNTVKQIYNCSNKYIDNVNKDAIFIDVGWMYKTSFPKAHLITPCITTKSGLWCFLKNRPANCKEHLLLQGFENFIQVVSNTQMKKQVGNSMSVNVLKVLLENLLESETI